MKSPVFLILPLVFCTPGVALSGDDVKHFDSVSVNSSERISISGGMGVSYTSAPDVVEFINAASSARVAEFKSVVEFFGAVGLPLSAAWVLKLEYAHMLGTYNVSGGFGGGEFTLTAHLPTITAQYVLTGEKSHNVKVGLGVGYHFGVLSAKYLTLQNDYTASGLGTKIEIEANTAIGEAFFAYLGGDIRWDFMGNLTASDGGIPRTSRTTIVPTLHFFSVGAKLGFTFYL